MLEPFSSVADDGPGYFCIRLYGRQVCGLFCSVVVKTVCIVSRCLKYPSGLMISGPQVVS